ncbi:hypothetical protein BFJ68_g13675 [Fusarium oxysporum]|uniref:Uncharacterized protein n=1 Tax=Fusarium oxysporum TaxID=5507 RepID=A0A420Q0L0_FUSOX|nr:hypothetical protein BFJ68_g13675 [Fusarium oxysporum]
MLFCLTDLSGIVATSTGMPIVELILQATGSRAGTTFLTLMLAICFIHGTNGSITSASRLLYAMARDKDYVSAVIGIFAIFLTGYWVFYGKKTFQGPDLDVILGERPDLAEATDELAMEEKKVESPTE